LAGLTSVDTVINKYAKLVRNAANEEKNSQLRLFREVFVSNTYPEYQIAKNVIQADEHCGDMKLSPAMEPFFESIQDLQDCLMSSELYTCAPLYDILSSGFEDGKMRGMSRRGPTPLPDLLTIAHEAHFRCELFAVLKRQSYRHGMSQEAGNKRAEVYKYQVALVEKDRRLHGVDAWATRQKNLGNVDAANSEDEDAPELHGAVTLNSKFY
jgi:hypothetical protein